MVFLDCVRRYLSKAVESMKGTLARDAPCCDHAILAELSSSLRRETVVSGQREQNTFCHQIASINRIHGIEIFVALKLLISIMTFFPVTRIILSILFPCITPDRILFVLPTFDLTI